VDPRAAIDAPRTTKGRACGHDRQQFYYGDEISFHGGAGEVKVTEGLFSFVALDENHRPRPMKRPV
jgi:hypothetical protein